jgi:hypothetical protein
MFPQDILVRTINCFAAAFSINAGITFLRGREASRTMYMHVTIHAMQLSFGQKDTHIYTIFTDRYSSIIGRFFNKNIVNCRL